MALALRKAAPLKPEVLLAQALSEFEAILSNEQKTSLRTYKSQKPPEPNDVMRLTAEIDRDARRGRLSRRCVGPRLTNVLQAIQGFTAVVDFAVSSSQSPIASTVWGAVKLSLQTISAFTGCFDKLSTLFMDIGRSCPLCQYFVIVINLCKEAVQFTTKSFIAQLSSSVVEPFDSKFGGFQTNLAKLATTIREDVSLESKRLQNLDYKEASRFRTLATKFSEAAARDLEKANSRRKQKALRQSLDSCSTYNHQTAWKQACKKGSVSWIFNEDAYIQWQQETGSSTLHCSGILGSGKTVLAAKVVESLCLLPSNPIVIYFFCRCDEVQSLQARTIVGSISRQMLAQANLDDFDPPSGAESSDPDPDQMLIYVRRLLPSKLRKCFLVIDGLDECEREDVKTFLEWFQELLSGHVIQLFCSSRTGRLDGLIEMVKPRWYVKCRKQDQKSQTIFKIDLRNAYSPANSRSATRP